MQRTIYVCDRCENETPKAELYSVTVKPPRGKQRNALELCSTSKRAAGDIGPASTPAGARPANG